MPADQITQLTDEDFYEWTLLQHAWPDYLAFRFDDNGDPEVLFIIQRSRSYPLNADREAMVKVLEKLGLTVRIRTPEGVLMSLQDFKQGAVVTRTTTLARQTIYQYRSQIKLMKAQLSRMSEDDPRRTKLINQINAKEWLVAESTPPPKLQDEIQRSFVPKRNPWGYNEEVYTRLCESIAQKRKAGVLLSAGELERITFYEDQQIKMREQEEIDNPLLKAERLMRDHDKLANSGNTVKEGAKNGTESV